MSPHTGDGGWATRPQDTRERTCECGLGGLSVLHTLRVARNPDPRTVTVARTHEATVEWTADLDLPGWLRSLAEVSPAYSADRFGPDEGPDRPEPRDGPDGAGADGRFRVAPVDATIRPPDGGPPALSDPYHYWNTPLSRLLADDNYPGGVTSLALDLLEGPKALWSARATAGVDPATLPGSHDDYARVGLEFTARERFRRPTDGEETGDATGPPGDRDDPSGDPADADPWERAGDPVAPVTDPLGPAIASTLAPAARDRPGCEDPGAAVGTVERQVGAVWRAFRRRAGEDPYAVPDRAVETATSPPDDGSP